MIINQPPNDTVFKKLPLKKWKKKPLGDDAESRYWKSFKSVAETPCAQTIRQVCTSQNTHNLIAYTDGLTIDIFSSKKQQVKRTLQRFKTQIHSLAFRKDGLLLAAGHENGQLDVFNIKTKLPLRMFKNFKKAVQAIAFSSVSPEYLYGGSDEGSIKLFDVTQESVVRTIAHAHSDFIRSIEVLNQDQYHLLTGSYDRTIKLFDFRAQDQAPIMTFTTSDPVEGLVSLGQSSQFVSVQGTSTTLWDLRLAKITQNLNVNQKTVLGIKLVQGSDSARILTYGLDHQMKFIRPDIFQVVYQTKFDTPVMSADVTYDGQTLVIGDSLGKVDVLRRTQHGIEEEDEDKEKDYIPAYLKENPHLKKQIRNFQFFNRGIYHTPAKFDVKIVNTDQQQRLGVYDRLLVQFKYKDALMKAIVDKQSQVIVSLCDEMIARGVFEVAFRGLNQEEISEVLGFVKLKISNPKYQETCLYIMNHLLDEYPRQVTEQYPKISEIVNEERECLESMLEMKAILEMN